MHDHPFFAEKNSSGSGEFVVRGKTCWPGHGGIPVVPDERDRTPFFSRGELESNLCAGGIGETMLDHIIISHLRANTFRSIQIERPERRIDHMTEPIADCAGAKVQPTTPIPRNPERGVWAKGHRTYP